MQVARFTDAPLPASGSPAARRGREQDLEPGSRETTRLYNLPMRRLLLLLSVLLAAGSLVAALPASASSVDVRAKKKPCVLKKKAKCKKANLAKQKFGKLNLAGSDLGGANLSGATLTGTNLEGASLKGADLTGATLRNVNLAGVDLRGANLTRTTFSGGTLSAPATLRHDVGDVGAPKLDDVSVPDPYRCSGLITGPDPTPLLSADCRGADFRKATIEGTIFLLTDLRGANFFSATIENAQFTNVKLNGAFFVSARISYTLFTRNDMEGTNLQNVNCDHCVFLKNQFFNANFYLFRDEAALAKGGNYSLSSARGLGEALDVTVSGASSTRLEETGYWPYITGCTVAQCTFKVFRERPITITVMGPGTITASGITCTATNATTNVCTTSGATTAISIVLTPIVTKAVSISLTDLSTLAVAIDAIKIETVTSDGAVTATHTCSNASTCSTTYPVGSLVRFSFSASNTGFHGAPLYLELSDPGALPLGPAALPFVDLHTTPFELTTDVTVTGTLS